MAALVVCVQVQQIAIGKWASSSFLIFWDSILRPRPECLGERRAQRRSFRCCISFPSWPRR